MHCLNITDSFRRLYHDKNPLTIKSHPNLAANHAVIVKARADTSEFGTNWYNLFPQICDIMHRQIVGVEKQLKQVSVYSVDVTLRSAAQGLTPFTVDGYEQMRRLFRNLELKGRWEDVPILKVESRGFKRKRGSGPVSAGRPLGSAATG